MKKKNEDNNITYSICVGVLIGCLIDNIALGVAIGICLLPAFGMIKNNKK